MGTGFKGTFVLSWSQAELDGLTSPQLSALRIGASWSWSGQSVRVDGPGDVLRLDQADEDRNIRRRAARIVRRLVGQAIQTDQTNDLDYIEDPLLDGGFVLTDGRTSYTATLIEVPGAAPLVMFLDELPPAGREYWVVQVSRRAVRPAPMSGGVICFTPGTRIATPYGAVPVEELREGDRVITKDNGPSEILWTGARHMSGARLYACPDLRPVRISAGAFGIDRPDDALLVSPEHRLLVKGPVAQALFNTPEVLARARDLINGTSIRQDLRLREVTYVHLLLDSHQVIWANGVETESFHPAHAALSALSEDDRERLVSGMPDLQHDPMAYGDFARRNLTKPEAAIMMHAA